jgi:hypothetical protein
MAAITAAAIGAAGTIYATSKASKDAKKQRDLAKQGIAAADPYAPYRADAAERLNALVKDPSSIQDTPEYQARMQASTRQLAAQGYTGSGNAIVEAADAGAAVYQQAFDNLSRLSGANVAPGGGYDSALSAGQASNDQQMSSLAGVTNNLSNLALTVGSRFNRPAGSVPPAAPTGSGSGVPRIGTGGP